MIAGFTSAAHAETVMDAVAMSVRRTFFIFCSPVFVRQFCVLTETPLSGSQLGTGRISSCGRMARILAWPWEKFTKNFSTGKKNRSRPAGH
jgi:hypothetical protein